MTHITFSDYRQPMAGQAYEIAFDYLARTGAIREEFDTCVFLVQCLTRMIEQGHSNKIRMANQAISEHQRYLAKRYAQAPGTAIDKHDFRNEGDSAVSNQRPNPPDKEPAEGSREVIDRELQRKEAADSAATKADHLPGAKVSGQSHGGTVDRAREREKDARK
jgi:hypothetical protein